MTCIMSRKSLSLIKCLCLSYIVDCRFIVIDAPRDHQYYFYLLIHSSVLLKPIRSSSLHVVIIFIHNIHMVNLVYLISLRFYYKHRFRNYHVIYEQGI